MMINIEMLETGPLAANTYVVWKDDSRDCFIIDPADGPLIKKYIDNKGLNCTHILITHGHFDHILGVAYLKAECGAKVCIHENDGLCLENDKYSLAAFVKTTTEKCKADVLFKDGDKVDINNIGIEVMHTPGHSRGSVCYILEEQKVIFSGDTLFFLSVGRCDLMFSDKSDLASSILYKLYMLKGDYKVLPGHGEATSLDFERNNNPVTFTMDYE